MKKFNKSALLKMRHAELLSLAVSEGLCTTSDSSLSRKQLLELLYTVSVEVNPPFPSDEESSETPNEISSVEDSLSEESLDETPKPIEVKPAKSKSEVKSAIEKALLQRSSKLDRSSSFANELARRQGKQVYRTSLDEELKIRANKFRK